jgi:hypothetical protein
LRPNDGQLPGPNALRGPGILTHIPSTVGGEQGIAVGVLPPLKPRYSNGAPVMIHVPGGVTTGGTEGRPEYAGLGFVEIRFAFPGGGSGEAASGGTYDYRGSDCIRALADVILFATGRLADKEDRKIQDLLANTTVLTRNVGLVGSSHGGNACGLVMATHGEEFPDLAFYASMESPYGEGNVNIELGGRDQGMNPAYNPETGVLDLSKLGWSSELPPGPPRRWQGAGSPLKGALFFDLNGDGRFSESGDFPANVFVQDLGKGMKAWYSPRLIREAEQRKLYGERRPNHIPSLAESTEYWRWRDAAGSIAAAVRKCPSVAVIVYANERDHVQVAPDHPHILTQLEGFRKAGAKFVRLNPDRAYVERILAGGPQNLAPGQRFPDNDAGVARDRSNIRDGLEPESLPMMPYMQAAVCELADRVQARTWAKNLEAVLYPDAPSRAFTPRLLEKGAKPPFPPKVRGGPPARPRNPSGPAAEPESSRPSANVLAADSRPADLDSEQGQDQRPYVINDTGQTTAYDSDGRRVTVKPGERFYGQDAHYVTNPMRFRDNGDGTVTDLNTGLLWVKTPDLANKATFAEAKAGAVKCRTGGYTDWRLPTIKELYSLVNFSGGMGHNPPKPYLDTRYFDFVYGDPDKGEREIDAQYWSATEYVGLTMRGDATVFGVNFADGRIKGYPRDRTPRGPFKGFVRYVRGNPQYGRNDFVDNGDGTITDRATGLMWAKADSGKTLNWEEALAYAETLRLAGHTDWRLPDAKELQSIVDYTRAPDAATTPARGPAIDPIFAMTEPESYFWTSTTHLDAPGPMFGTMAVYICFGRAMGNMPGPGGGPPRWINVHGAGRNAATPRAATRPAPGGLAVAARKATTCAFTTTSVACAEASRSRPLAPSPSARHKPARRPCVSRLPPMPVPAAHRCCFASASTSNRWARRSVHQRQHRQAGCPCRGRRVLPALNSAALAPGSSQ